MAPRRSNPAVPPPPGGDDTEPLPVPGPVRVPREPRADRRVAPARRREPAREHPLRLLIGTLLVTALLGGLTLTALVGRGDHIAAPLAPLPVTVYRPGVHVVGDGVDEMSAGRYRTRGPVGDGAPCAYARLSGLDGRAADVIAERAVTGPATLRVRPTDAGVTLAGPCLWIPEP